MSLAFYVQNTDSSDDHSGSSASVIASGSSTADVTQGNATIDLSDAAPDLSGVNQSETRDTIRLDGRSDGINGTDVFEIISVDDENDTVEVSPTPTQASQSDLDWCIGGPFASCQRAADVERAGDHIYVKVGTYQPVGADNWLIKIKHAGTAGSPIVWEGYRATPGDADDYLQAHLDLLPEDGTFDDYRPVLDGSVSSDDGIMVDGGFGQNPCYHTFRHFDVSACIIGLNTQVSGGYATRVRLVNSKLTACVLPVYCSACDLDGCDVVNSAMGGMWVPNGASVYGCAVHNSNGGGFGSNSGKFTLMFSRFWD
ncbi:MAG: hypothetical protein JXQ75_06860, partial [Phycisphaerae bacterium]|nr:hypothetical protein [Phycisphaerae bacterium]